MSASYQRPELIDGYAVPYPTAADDYPNPFEVLTP